MGQSPTCSPPSVHKFDCVFLTYLQTGHATATWGMNFRNQYTWYVHHPSPSNSPTDLRGSVGCGGSSKVKIFHQLCDPPNICQMPAETMKVANVNLSLSPVTKLVATATYLDQSSPNFYPSEFFSAGVYAAIRIVIHPPVVEWKGRHLKTKKIASKTYSVLAAWLCLLNG